MSRLRLLTFLETPLRPAFASAAETRSAKIWAKRSARASNGCEDRLGIVSLMPNRTNSRNYGCGPIPSGDATTTKRGRTAHCSDRRRWSTQTAAEDWHDTWTELGGRSVWP